MDKVQNRKNWLDPVGKKYRTERSERFVHIIFEKRDKKHTSL